MYEGFSGEAGPLWHRGGLCYGFSGWGGGGRPAIPHPRLRLRLGGWVGRQALPHGRELSPRRSLHLPRTRTARCARCAMASLTQAQQEDAFAQHTYESARAAGRAAKLVGEGIISARFVYATPGSADVGLGTFDLSAVALDLKSLSQIALHVGAQYEGRSLFALDLVKSGDLYDALFSEQQFSDFKESYTAELEALSAQGHTKVRAVVRGSPLLALTCRRPRARLTPPSGCASWPKAATSVRQRTWTPGASGCTGARCAGRGHEP